MEGATTRLWIPIRNRKMNIKQEMVKNGWFIKDWVKETCFVCSSESHCQAPLAVQIEMRTSTTRQRAVEGRRYLITSVNRRSKALRSSVCSSDMVNSDMCPTWFDDASIDTPVGKSARYADDGVTDCFVWSQVRGAWQRYINSLISIKLNESVSSHCELRV